MQDFESKEFRSHVNAVNAQNEEFDIVMENVQLAEVELDKDILLAVHRC
ncbi:hypothetical protein RAL73_002190 [Vibrio cholerae]|nr:hypothetical protein [Vibrio cholerae]EHU8077110.1 hypothetical protein [Vibrio cholerae]EHV9953264.1 hypothetical protein [Vibrio cholerae]ELG4676618.1 hypothetical protein [Vibrio cholerae]